MSITATRRPKFSVQSKIMDFSSKIDRVISQTTCDVHEAGIGQICFQIVDDGGTGRAGICGPRSRKIFTGVSSPKHSSPSQRPNAPRSNT